MKRFVEERSDGEEEDILLSMMDSKSPLYAAFEDLWSTVSKTKDGIDSDLLAHFFRLLLFQFRNMMHKQLVVRLEESKTLDDFKDVRDTLEETLEPLKSSLNETNDVKGEILEDLLKRYKPKKDEKLLTKNEFAKMMCKETDAKKGFIPKSWTRTKNAFFKMDDSS